MELIEKIIINHILALYSIQYIDSFSTFMTVFLLYQIGGLSITMGSHRLWSHRSYKAKDPTRFLLMLIISMSNQGSIYHWVRDHRVHHKYSDTDADPHNINNGFFFSHIGWLMTKKNNEVIKAKYIINRLMNEYYIYIYIERDLYVYELYMDHKII